MSKVVELLRDKACYYLDHTCETIDKSLIHVPSPDTIDKVWIDSDRNIRVLNSLQTLLGLIPEMGVNGAALATFVSYFVVFLLRAVSASRAVQMHWNIPKIALNLLIVGAQSAIMIYELPYWVLWELGLTGLMAVINLGPVWHSLRGVLAKRRGK